MEFKVEGELVMNIYLLYGGKSAEHDISIISAYHIMNEIYYDYYKVQPIFITQEGTWLKGNKIESKENVPTLQELRDTNFPAFDIRELVAENNIVFPVLHGPNGEDGTVQGLLETLNVPYVGAGVLASAAGMDKIVSKILFQDAGIPIVPYQTVTPSEWTARPEETIETIASKLPYPMYVKPANLGSSVGISEVNTNQELEEAINLAFQYDNRVLIEKGIEATEVEVAVLGNEDVHTSVVGALVKETQFYDYEAKYVSSDVMLEIPANIPKDISVKLREYATKAFIAIDGSGLARVDFFLTNDEEIYINEVNTFPGFTPISMYPKLWEETGLSYGDLIEELIQLGLSRFEERTKRYGKGR